jgi:hypothetical protein
MQLPPQTLTDSRIAKKGRAEILAIINGLVDSVVNQYGTKGPVVDNLFAPTGKKQKPFLLAMFPELIRASEVERSVSTKMGGVMQRTAGAIARSVGYKAECEYDVTGRVAPEVLTYIRKLVRPGKGKEKSSDAADLEAEIATIKSLNNGPTIEHSVTIDLFVEADGEEFYFDLKTPSPNSDQPRDMKDRLMRARALRLPKDVTAQAVFYYNPQGLNGPYSNGRLYLDYARGEVLVGRQFWDKLAGPGTYEELVRLFEVVGQQRRTELLALL